MYKRQVAFLRVEQAAQIRALGIYLGKLRIEIAVCGQIVVIQRFQRCLAVAVQRVVCGLRGFQGKAFLAPGKLIPAFDRAEAILRGFYEILTRPVGAPLIGPGVQLVHLFGYEAFPVRLAASVAVAANLRVQGAAQVRDGRVQLLQRIGNFFGCRRILVQGVKLGLQNFLLGLKFRLQGVKTQVEVFLLLLHGLKLGVQYFKLALGLACLLFGMELGAFQLLINVIEKIVVFAALRQLLPAKLQ